MDALMLSRMQFAFTIAFHILFPAFTIGLASWLVMLELLWLLTGRPAYQSLYRFWSKIFAVSFGMGVVMGFQFGSNWSGFARLTGNVLGPLLGYEVLTAFFLEATFLGVMLFGMDRVGKRMHFASTCVVALGTVISAFWILAANSWMNTPSGAVLRDGVYQPLSWWHIIFNPSFPYRFVHMMLAAYLCTCFVVAGVAATYLLRGRFPRRARLMLRLAVIFAVITVPLQIVAGDFHGENTREHQPAKVAAIEAHWVSRAGAPLVLFAVPDERAETNDFELAVPKLGSLILTHSLNGRVVGLDAFDRSEWPPVAPVFFAFRIMVGIGLLMLAVAIAGVIALRRGRLHDTRWLLRTFVWMMPSGFIAVLAGWSTTEIGRQPYVVYGALRTADALSPVPGGDVALTLVLFGIVYTGIFGAGVYYMLRLIRRGPEEVERRGRAPRTPARPLSHPEEVLEDVP
jgi:cytochrome d ubiquinol oxidase subunit I